MTVKTLKGHAIVYAADLKAGLTLRDRLKADGFGARVVDANEFKPGAGLETPCTHLVFLGARNSVEIAAAYEAAGRKVETIDVALEGQAAEPAPATNAMSATAAAQPDALTVKLNAMTKREIREFAAINGIDLPVDGTVDVDTRKEALIDLVEKALRTVPPQA